MTDCKPGTSKLAKQGDTQAIAALINCSLQSKGITARVSLKQDCLKIMLEAVQVPDKQMSVELIHKELMDVGTNTIKQVKVFGREIGEDFPSWQAEFEVPTQATPDFTELAKQGNTDAIRILIAQWLEPQNVTAKVSLKDSCLRVMLEAVEVPNQQTIVPLVFGNVKDLGIQGCTKIKLSGREPGDDFPDWQQDLELEEQTNSTEIVPVESSTLVSKTATQESGLAELPSESSFWGSMFGTFTERPEPLVAQPLMLVVRLLARLLGLLGRSVVQLYKLAARSLKQPRSF